jgi:hypothetical protein
MPRMMPPTRRCRMCPLPSRERAARYFSKDEGVRGQARGSFRSGPLTHHHLLRHRCALSREGRGHIRAAVVRATDAIRRCPDVALVVAEHRATSCVADAARASVIASHVAQR